MSCQKQRQLQIQVKMNGNLEALSLTHTHRGLDPQFNFKCWCPMRTINDTTPLDAAVQQTN